MVVDSSQYVVIISIISGQKQLLLASNSQGVFMYNNYPLVCNPGQDQLGILGFVLKHKLLYSEYLMGCLMD